MTITTINRTIAALLPLTDYVVRVKSYNKLGVSSDWSEALLFKTDNSPFIPGATFPTFVGTDLPSVHTFSSTQILVAHDTYLYQSATSPSIWIYDGQAWISLTGNTFETSQTYSVSGILAIAINSNNYLPPFFMPVQPGQIATLTGIRHVLRNGTADITINHNSTAIGSITATTIPTTSPFTVAVSSDDPFSPTITSVGSSADGLSMSFYFRVSG